MVEFILANSPTTTGSTPIRTIGGANQQIIVIPQSLLSSASNTNTTGKFVVTTPAIKSLAKKPTVKVAPTIMTTSNQKISLKRPLPQTSPELKKELDEEDEEGNDSTPARKRANLDHLTPEEKMMRRKLKNRVAAQNARDKKRAKMDDMEVMIQKMEEEKQKLREENEKLKQINERLMVENNNLKRDPSGSDYLLPPSPDSMPPMSPGMNDSTIVVPRPSEPAELTNALLPKGQGLGMAVGQKNDEMTAISAAACLFWTCLVTPFLANNNSSSNKSEVHSNKSISLASTRLPLKKRNNNTTWWGPHQGSWNPTKT